MTKDTANKFISKALKIDYVLGYKDYSHSDFTSIMVGNTQDGDTTWARWIGSGEYAIFVALDRKSHQSRGYKGYTDEALNVVSNYGKYGIRVDWGAGAGGRNNKTDLAEKFFGGYYNFSSCLQEAFGGPKSDNWENEEVALKFIAWAENINDISDIIQITSLKKDKALFSVLKTFIVDLTLAIEENAKNPKYDDKELTWLRGKSRVVASDVMDSITIPKELQQLKDFSVSGGKYGGYLRVAGKNIEPILREMTNGEIKCFWRQTSERAPKPIKTPDDMANWIGNTIKFTSTFNPATFLS